MEVRVQMMGHYANLNHHYIADGNNNNQTNNQTGE